MGNTIRRPRRRPRVKSVNFRALWWLVRWEACWAVWRVHAVPWLLDTPVRRAQFLARRRVGFYLRRWPLVKARLEDLP